MIQKSGILHFHGLRAVSMPNKVISGPRKKFDVKNWPTFHIKFFSWAWNHLIWHTDCSKNPLGVLSPAWKIFWYISMFQVIKISYWTIEKWTRKITYFSSMAYTKKIRKKVSPQKIPTGSLSLVHKSYMVTEASLPFISPKYKIRLQKWTVLHRDCNYLCFGPDSNLDKKIKFQTRTSLKSVVQK